MNKNRIRLTESQLRNVIKENVKKAINETYSRRKIYHFDENGNMFSIPYEEHFKLMRVQQMEGTLNKMVETSNMLRGMLLGIPTGGEGGDGVRFDELKQAGFTRSYKRLLKAYKLSEKIYNLLKAVKQDVTTKDGNYYEKPYERFSYSSHSDETGQDYGYGGF